jgi:hypothetical protein
VSGAIDESSKRTSRRDFVIRSRSREYGGRQSQRNEPPSNDFATGIVPVNSQNHLSTMLLQDVPGE